MRRLRNIAMAGLGAAGLTVALWSIAQANAGNAPTREQAGSQGQDEGAAPPQVFVHRGAPDPLEVSSGACVPDELVRGAKLVAMGVYEGGTDLSLSLDPGGHATTQVVVAGARKGPDLFLVLSAYDPVVWNFHGFPTDRLRGVLVYGYYHQAVAHLSNQVPVVFATRPAPQSACGRSTYAYKGGAELDRFVRTVEAATGRPVDAFQGGYSPDALHVDGGAVQGSTVQPEPAALRSSGDVTVDAVAPGDGGIRQLLREGYLRPATPADVADWNAAATRASRSGHLAPVQSDYLRVEDSLVVLRRTRLPKGMYGAHARAFIVPHKALLPDDSGSHNSFYFLDDGSCTGAGSGC